MGKSSQDHSKSKRRWFSREPKVEKDQLVTETIGELKDIVANMKEIFEQFDEGYKAQLEEERSAWEKMQARLPAFLQFNSNVKNEERRRERIKSNRENLEMLQDSLSKLEIVLSSSQERALSLEDEYVQAIMPEAAGDKKAIRDLEKRMEEMESNIAEAMQHLSGQIRLIKSAMDNVAGQLDEQGVVLEGIDQKIDVLDSKLDRVQELIKKVSRQITNGRLLFLFGFVTVTGVFVANMLN